MNKRIEQDKYLYKLEKEIKQKKDFILNKKKELEEKVKENKYLEKVYSKYNNFFLNIIKEKKKQILVMEKINRHIDKIIKEDNLLNSQLKKANYDKEIVINELNKLKEEL